jgi:hypothetical protein
MNRKMIALNLALVALVLWAGYGLRQMWLASRARDAAEFGQKVGPVPVPPLTPLPNPQAVVPAKYKNIADKDLLSRDRNPDVPVEPPPPPPPEPPMPPLPVYHGLMNLGDGPTAFMGLTATSPYEIVHPGESIGQFKLLSVNEKEIELEWHGKKVHKLVDELTDNSQSAPAAVAAQTADAGQGRPVNAPPVSAPPQEPPSQKGPGEEHSAFGTASCQANDTTPDGTVVNGYRKIHRRTPFGNICMWEQVGK